MTELISAATWVDRYHPRPHGSGLLHGLAGLVDLFVRSMVASLGWHAGASIARLLGGWLVVLALLAVAAWAVYRVAVRRCGNGTESRRGGRRGTRRGGRRIGGAR